MGEDSADAGIGTRVQRLYQRLLGLGQPDAGLNEDERADRLARTREVITTLVRLPAETLADVECKLAVVGDRLRAEDHTLASPFGALTLLLLDAARDDLARLTTLHAGIPGAAGAP